MSAVGSNIRRYRIAKGLKQAELAKLLGKTANVVTNWESGLNRPDVDSIEKMLGIFEIDANEFFGKKGQELSTLTSPEQNQIKKYRVLDEHGKKMVDFTLNEEHERVKRLEQERLEQERLAQERREIEAQKNKTPVVPVESDFEEEEEAEMVEMKVYWQPAAAGIGNYLTDDDGFDLLSFPDEEIPSQADFGVRISGDSMEPKISDGDIVWVKATPQIENGEIGIFILDGDALCKKLHIDYKNKKIKLVSLNRKRKDIEITGYESLRTVGKVLLKKY